MRLFAATCLSLLSLFACTSTDSPKNSVQYTLTVNNKASRDADLYLNAHLDSSGFVSEGTVAAGQSKQIGNLVVGASYTLRAVEVGASIDSFFNEQTIENPDPEKYSVSVDIVDQSDAVDGG